MSPIYGNLGKTGQFQLRVSNRSQVECTGAVPVILLIDCWQEISVLSQLDFCRGIHQSGQDMRLNKIGDEERARQKVVFCGLVLEVSRCQICHFLVTLVRPFGSRMKFHKKVNLGRKSLDYLRVCLSQMQLVRCICNSLVVPQFLRGFLVTKSQKKKTKYIIKLFILYY